MKNISIKSVFGQAQDVFMRAPWHWVFVTLIQFFVLVACLPLIGAFTAAINAAFFDSVPWFILNVFPFLMSTLYLIVIWSIMLNFYRMAQAAITGKDPEVKDIFRPDTRLTSFVLTAFAVAVITYIGTNLLVIPGIIASIVLFFADVSSVEEHTSPIDSLYRSYELVRKDWWAVILFIVATGIFSIIAIIPFGIGLLFYVPFIAISKIIFFRDIRSFEPMVIEAK